MSRLIERHVARQGAKVSVAQLQSHGPGVEAVVAQPARNELGQVRERALELLAVVDVGVKRGLVTDRLGLFLISVRVCVLAPRLDVQPLAVAAEALPQALPAPLLEVADGVDA